MKDIPATLGHKHNRAKTRIMCRAPFFGALMLQCQHIWTEDVPTMATDGKNILLNPVWVDELTHEEFVGVLIHEICHKMFLHIIRAQKYAEFENGRVKDIKDMPKLRKWNMACDYAINPIIKDSGFDLPSEGLCDDKFRDMLAEEIYELLTDEECEDKEENHFVFGDAPLTEKETQSLSRQVTLEVDAAATQTSRAGKLPDSIKKLLETNSKTKVDWRASLADFIEESIFGDDDITFKRPDRRMLVHDLYLPSTEGLQVPPICIMFDTSGSIYSYPETVQQFVAEIQSIVQHLSPEAVHLICNDTRVQSHEIYERGEDFEVELKGGGGTCFINAFKELRDLADYPPAVNIVFTDLEFDYEAVEPSCPTLWITYGRPHNYVPSFGRVLHIEG